MLTVSACNVAGVCKARWAFLFFFFFMTASAFGQKAPGTPIGPGICESLRQQYVAAVKAGNGALVHTLGEELNAKGCNAPPNSQPTPAPVLFTVGAVQSVPFAGGGPSEAQSTVVLPGKNASCPNGRLLISNDTLRPPSSIVVGRDLSGKSADTVSTFDNPSHPENYSYVTNDHDLIAMGDGSVLYLTGAASREPLKPQPAWWNVAYRGAFGPGARGILMVWRSTDCGASFHYISEMDPAVVEDGSCANPQLPLDKNNHYDMGGSDGQLVVRDPSNDRLYLTFRCVGYVSSTDSKGNFTLTNTGLNKTLIAYSSDRGSNWHSMGFMDGVDWWRMGGVPLGNKVAFGFWNALVFGSQTGGPQAGNKMSFGEAQQLNGQYGGFNWSTSPFNPNPSPDAYVYSNVWGNTVIARAGESQDLLIAFPTQNGSGSKAGNGYSVFFHKANGSGYVEIPAINPLTSSPSSYVMELTAIDLGSGPVLLYWTDMNTTTHKSRIRGRVIVSMGQYSQDFDITGDIDVSAGADKASPAYFYGDYHTAGGVEQKGLVHAYHFYPIWVDRTGGARFAEVSVSAGGSLLSGGRNLPLNTVAMEQWRPLPPKAELRSFKGRLPKVRQPEREPSQVRNYRR